VNLVDVKRRLFDLLASSIGRHVHVNRWVYSTLNKVVELPFTVESTGDVFHVFETRVDVPDSNLVWLLKLAISGNALLEVDGKPLAGVDEAHTYSPLEPGKHAVKVTASPRSLFGYHKWNLVFESAYLVEVAWNAFSFALRALKLVEFVESLMPGKLRADFEELLYGVFSKVRFNPSLRQIALTNILLYSTAPVPYFKGREDLPRPYGDYLWLTGVYGLGVLKGALPDIEDEDVCKAIEASKALERALYTGLQELSARYGKPGLAFAAGHSHIDAAWLWPRAETVEKVLRTFSTIVSLMREYKFTYLQSSAQYYEWVEERAPHLFEEVRKLVEEKRWIVVGGMWVESDTQLVDGESIARQFLHGQRYFKSRFNRLARVGWLPDSFGFSGNLPQIMKLSGIEVFVTHKVMWNDTNEFPYHAFRWRGIDGTEIQVHIIVPSYGEPSTPASVHRYWERYKSKEVTPFIVYAYGYSDGGGGPTREMLELLELDKIVPGIPRVEHFDEEKYINELRKARSKLPVWNGEIYVEAHRGTYTTNFKVKELMARAEVNLLQAEIASTLADILGLEKPNKELINSLWKLLLFNQFHDVLPGSSVKEVYDDAYRDLEYVIRSSEEVIGRALRSASKSSGDAKLVVLNTLPWRRKVIIEMGKEHGIPVTYNTVECQDAGDRYYVSVELIPLGFKALKLMKARCTAGPGVLVRESSGGIVLENEHITLEVGKGGDIVSAILKNEGVEVFSEPSNKLVAHIDKPGTWDAWDIRRDFLHEGVELVALGEPRVTIRGPLVSCIGVIRGFEKSTVDQEICLYKDSPLVEIRNRLLWRSKGVLVKTWFTINAEKTRAFFEVPYGVLERPTRVNSTWDEARYEVPALRWADLEGESVSLAVIAPSRHGYAVHGNRLGLSLIRSPAFPNPWSDLGVFETTYYLYPHTGNYEEAAVPKITQEVLHKAFYAIIRGTEDMSLLEIEPPRLVLSAFKPAEDLDGYVLRLFNPCSKAIRIKVRINPVVRVLSAFEVDIPELNVLREFEVQEGVVEVEVEPFKILTLKLRLAGSRGEHGPETGI